MDFIVLRVNGRDVSGASHEEAVEAFRLAHEPILVEVLRRDSKHKMADVLASSPAISPTYCDTSTQTEWVGGWELGFFPVTPTSSQHHHAMAIEDDEEVCEIEYEEVTLQRSSSAEKLGLTLCYGEPEEQETEIYVGEIEPLSVAAKDGRLQEGDQILQVNGIDVAGRDQAISLFSEKRPDFTLLVARPHIQQVNDFLARMASPFPSLRYCCVLEEVEEEPDQNGSSVLEKDSGMGKTDESTRNGESSDEPLLPSMQQQIEVLSKELQSITLDGKASVEQWVRNTAFLRKWDGDSSSAYHTGSSSPPTLELAAARCGSVMSLSSPRTEDKSTQLRESDVASVLSCESCRKCCLVESPQRRLPKTVSEPACMRRAEPLTLYPCTTMYTNPANLQHTIWLQQQLFRQALARRSRENSQSPSKCTATAAPADECEEAKMEWKVKRRADGTRYITRRPARSRLLKEREMRILEERGGITTDDDTMSELKIGKYWPKEERKRHLEKARDRKKREMMLKVKMAILREQAEDERKDKPHEHKKTCKKKGKDDSPVDVVATKTFGLLAVTTV